VKGNGLALICSTVLAFPAHIEETRENYVGITDCSWGIAPTEVQW
jgi:hypothetical protein